MMTWTWDDIPPKKHRYDYFKENKEKVKSAEAEEE